MHASAGFPPHKPADVVFPLDYLDLYHGFQDDLGRFDEDRVSKSSLCVRKGGLHWYVQHHLEESPHIIRTDKTGSGVINWKYTDVNNLHDSVGITIRTRWYRPGEGPPVKLLKANGKAHEGRYNLFGWNCGDYAGTQFDYSLYGHLTMKHELVFRPKDLMDWYPRAADQGQS